MKLEVVVVPVSDVDRAKTFYKALGWREDVDFVTGARLPGRVTPAPAVHDSAADLAEALRRAAAAHGKHEEETGQADPDWPEEFQLIPRGSAAAFASITPSMLSVYPDNEQRAVVRFAPPRGPQSLAGVAPFDIMARSEIHSDVSDLACGRLTITPFEDLSAVLTPEVGRGRKPRNHQVSLVTS